MLSRRSGLRRVSLKRQAQQPEYDRAVNQVMLRAHGVCEVGAMLGHPEDCHGRLDPHHIWLQSHYPEHRCNPDAILACCRWHHDYLHRNPVWAREHGLLK